MDTVPAERIRMNVSGHRVLGRGGWTLIRLERRAGRIAVPEGPMTPGVVPGAERGDEGRGPSGRLRLEPRRRPRICVCGC